MKRIRNNTAIIFESSQDQINKIGKYPFGGIIKPYVMGISARGTIKRSDHGMMYAIKDNLVGDNIELIIEFEARRQ